jgi:hypothetical protein
MVGLGSSDSSRAQARWISIAYAAVLIGLLAVLFDSAYEQIFSTLNTPDDEGYAIITLRSFADGNALYDEVYSQYGPGFYTLVGGAMKLAGIAFTSEGARWVNLFLWLGSTALAALILLRLTRSLVISAAGLLIAFLVLSADAYEPLHPGATIGFLLLVLVAAVVYLFPSRIPLAMASVGALALALASVKINVGGLAMVSILFACVLTSPILKRLTPLRWFAIAAFVLVPFMLMHSKLDDGHTLRWAAILGAGALALTVVALHEGPGTRPDRRDLRWLIGGAVGVLALVTVVPVILGTSPGGLLDGWLVRPAEQPGIVFAPLTVDELGPVWALFGLLAAAAYTIWVSEAGASRRVRTTLGLGRIAIGVGIWLAFATPVLGLPAELTRATVIASPFAWLAAIGRPGEAPELRFVRVLIPALALLQTLHAFPIPGAQLAWSEILFLIVGGICISDGIEDVAALGRELRPSFGSGWRALASVAVVAVGIWFAVDRVKPFTDDADALYAASVPIGLPGTDRMRTNELRAEQLRDLSRGIEQNCDTFLTLPGMSSLYLYTGEPVPEEMSSPWMLFLTDSEQADIVAKVRDDPRLCVVRKPDLLAFWVGYTDGRGVPDRPLVRFIRDDFHTLHDYSGYYLDVRN